MLPEFINITNLTFIFSVVTPILLVYYKFNLDKKLRRSTVTINELMELNTKMHDRLVEAEDAINTNNFIPNQTRKRLKFNASRLLKHDESISENVDMLIEEWTITMILKKGGHMKDSDISKTRKDLILLIRKIKTKVDRLLSK